jgi:serine phosphatase RsbU (regulator of sigma subunit)
LEDALLTNRTLDVRDFLKTLAFCVPMGLGMGALMRITGMIQPTLPALVIPTIFWSIMWPGFELFGPWLSFRPEDPRPPGVIARSRILRVVGLFTVLTSICWALFFLVTGLPLRQMLPGVLISYVIGLSISGLVSTFHTITNLANVERARAIAEADRVRKSEELEAARALQLSMLPQAAPEVPGLDVAFEMRTATEVGGDYYDYRVAADGTLTLAVGDATGHGVRAGLLVVAVKTLFHTGTGTSVAAEVQRAHEGVMSLGLSRMNMALTVLSIRDGTARVAAGGMPSMLHFQKAAARVVEVPTEAPPPGQMRRSVYTEKSFPLSPGDRLLLYTDGLPECRSPAEDLFGYERVAAVFEKSANGSPKEIGAALFAAADAFAAGRPYDDDLTVVVLGVNRVIV